MTRSLTRKRTRKSAARVRSEEHTSELQSRVDLVCRLLLEKKKEQFETVAVTDSQKTPPPRSQSNALVRVKPERLARLVRYKPRFDWLLFFFLNGGPFTVL